MSKVSVDFSNVSEGGKFTVPVGEYVAKIKSCTKEHGQSGFDYLKWTLIIASGGCKGNEITHNTTLKPEGLFALRDFLTACGLVIPKSVINFDPDKMIGKSLGIIVGEREYNGNIYPQIKKVKLASEVNLGTASTPVAKDDDDLLDDLDD
jgi:hypothetical protein